MNEEKTFSLADGDSSDAKQRYQKPEIKEHGALYDFGYGGPIVSGK